MTREIKIMLGVLVVVVVGIGALVIFDRGGIASPSPTPVAESVLVKPGSHSTGSPSAKVTLVEFGDFQCPVCGAAYPIVEQILANYQNNPNFNFVFRNFPIPSLHPNAMIAAEAAESAGAQGKYWDMYNQLYTHQTDWADSSQPLPIFQGYAQTIGINVTQFTQDVNSGKYASVVNSDEQDGENLGVNATPTFYLNGVQSVGVPDYNGLKSAIDALLAK